MRASHTHTQEHAHRLTCINPHTDLLTIHNDLNVLEVDFPAGQDPALTAVSTLICFLDAPDLQVVVGQDYEPDWKRQEAGSSKVSS